MYRSHKTSHETEPAVGFRGAHAKDLWVRLKSGGTDVHSLQRGRNTLLLTILCQHAKNHKRLP
uniref:Uncharacterized protein n=1 Tax=Anguilla anguilla TaxID=7936 RepID=A0A0E9XNJ2_ANGAN